MATEVTEFLEHLGKIYFISSARLGYESEDQKNSGVKISCLFTFKAVLGTKKNKSEQNSRTGLQCNIDVPDSKSRYCSRGRLSKALGSWDSGNLEGRGGLGEGWGNWGQFSSNLRLGRTVLTQLEGAK